MGGLKNRPSVRLITLVNRCTLHQAEVLQQRTSLSDFVYQRSLDEVYTPYSMVQRIIRAIFGELRNIFPSPAGARKNTSNEKNVRSYYMLNHRIRGLLFHYKKIYIYLAISFYFLVRVFRDILILSVKMTLTISKMFARIICQTIE